MNPLSLVFGAVGGLINGVKDIFSQKLTNDADKIDASVKLGELQLQVQQALLGADTQFAQAQQAVIVAEAQSGSWLPRNIRPLSLLTFLCVIVYQGVFVSIFKLPSVNLSAVPPQMWNLFYIGFGGYIVGRSVEKAVSNWGSNGTSSSGPTDT